MYMRMRARPFDRRPSYWFICGLLARKIWMKEGGGGVGIEGVGQEGWRKTNYGEVRWSTGQ